MFLEIMETTSDTSNATNHSFIELECSFYCFWTRCELESSNSPENSDPEGRASSMEKDETKRKGSKFLRLRRRKMASRALPRYGWMRKGAFFGHNRYRSQMYVCMCVCVHVWSNFLCFPINICFSIIHGE